MTNKYFRLFTLLTLTIVGCEKKMESNESVVSPVFKKISSEHSGITFKNYVDENAGNFFDVFAYVYNGGGVGIGDINNDGLSDIFFTGNEVPNKLYLNEGNMKFRDISSSAGIEGGKGWNNGVTMVDVNEDGFLDIYVCRGGWHDSEEQRRNLLFMNQKNLTFKEQSIDFGLDDTGYSIHASFFDMDNDNDLDVYITNRPDSFDLPLSEMVSQKKLTNNSSRDKLFKNENGRFTEIGRQAGITNNFGYALSVVTSDLNNDGYTDIFVANDFAESDYMYINQKNGTFKESIKQATNHISMYSMGTDVADINNDGWEDIMVSEMLPEDYKRSKVSMPSMDVEGFYEIVNSGMHRQYMHNALHLNQGNLFFSEISQLSGVAKTEWSWSCLLSDFDNDGYRDLFVANGYKRDVFDGDVHQKIAAFVRQNRDQYRSPQEMLEKNFESFIEVYEPIKVPNYIFRNNGDLQFQNVGEQWGLSDPSFSNGAAVGDLDNDGDLDLVINNLDDEAFLYENTSRNNFLKIDLVGPATNRNGIGAKVSVYYNGNMQYFENKTVRGYLSSNDPIVHFGLGTVTAVDSIKVVWNDGRRNKLTNLQINELISVHYTESSASAGEISNHPNKVFTESTREILSDPVIHRENEFNEYKDQILLPHMFSRSGPFIATGDVNQDGNEDFYLGGAAGQPGSLLVQKNGKMIQSKVSAFETDKMFEDMGAVFFDCDQDSDLDLYVVSGGAEFYEGSAKYQDRLYLNDGKGNFSKTSLPKTESSGSCVVPFDFDGDGDLDLFRGGHVVAGSYPRDPRSYLLINEKGKFVENTPKIAPALAKPGMVNSAAVADLNNDKTPELVVVGEWMKIKIFEYRDNKFNEVASDYGLENTEGWWNKVIAEDIDNDGDQDLILGNLGENYKFKTSVDKPFQVFAKDFDGNGTNDIFLARYYQDSLLVPIRGRECTSQQMPVIAQKFPTFTSFAESDLPSILGKDIENATHYEVHLFSSVMLINENAKLAVKKLPVEAQLSTVNCIIIHDFDKDGNKDILLAGNKFDVEVETTAADASPGLLMKGLGNLNFKCLKPDESGFFVPYNVKDAQMIKWNNSLAVLVTVNNDALKVYRLAN